MYLYASHLYCTDSSYKQKVPVSTVRTQVHRILYMSRWWWLSKRSVICCIRRFRWGLNYLGRSHYFVSKNPWIMNLCLVFEIKIWHMKHSKRHFNLLFCVLHMFVCAFLMQKDSPIVDIELLVALKSRHLHCGCNCGCNLWMCFNWYFSWKTIY